MANFIIFIGEQWMLVSALLILIFLFMQSEMRRGGQRISVHQLTNLVNNEGALVLDVRESAEYREGHILDSTNIPFKSMTQRATELEKHKDRPIVIVDKMGQHSGAVGKQLSEAGYNISRLDGGITEWKGSNLPLVKGKS